MATFQLLKYSKDVYITPFLPFASELIPDLGRQGGDVCRKRRQYDTTR